MPGRGNRINIGQVRRLVDALQGLEVISYTHKPQHVCRNAEAIKYCNDNGVAVNLSANNLKHADELYDLRIGPVVVVLPHDAKKDTFTPHGRRVVICPATLTDKITCSNCGGNSGSLCSRVKRKYIIGFPAHGARYKQVNNVAKGGKC